MDKSANHFDIDLVELEQMTILKASINNESELTSLPQGAGFDIKFRISPSASVEIKRIKITFECDIQAFENEEKVNKIGVNSKFEIAYIFFISNLDDLVKIENEEIGVPTDLVESLYNIAYSTSRGIIYTRCLGTILAKVILPITSTSKLIQMN